MDDGDYFKYYYNENGFLEKAVMYESDGIPKGIKQFIWDGDKLIAQNLVEDDVHTFVRTIYDADDEAIGLIFRQYDNETDTGEQIWLYRKNLQGDVTGVIDGFTGALGGSFTYDAYGMPGFHPVNDNQFSILSSAFTFVMLPQIYRGYTYFLVGNEICYYLGSRFYSPRMGRFLNADDVDYLGASETVLGYNAYAYCENNPVNDIDPDGHLSANQVAKWLLKVTNKILDYSKSVVEFLLSKYSVSVKKYIQMSSYGKTPKGIYTFVNNNKSTIKNLKNNLSSITWFLAIVIEIIDLSAILTKNYVKAVAEILFDGFVKLFTYVGSKFATWLITTICKPLKIAKNLINNVIGTLIETYFNNSNKISKIKSTYLSYINISKISFSNYIYALFQGVKQCI